MYKIMVIESSSMIEHYIMKLKPIFLDNFKQGTQSRMLLRGNLRTDAKEYLLDIAHDCEIVVLRADTGEEPIILELARRLREMTTFTEIIIVANDSRYAASGYEVDAIAYLPLSNYEEKMERIIAKAVQTISKKNMICILVEYDREIVRIPCRDIRYIESNKNIVSIHTEYGAFKDRRKLSEYESVLTEIPNYLRIHQSFAVNLTYCHKFERAGVTLFDGTFLPISRSRYNMVYEMLSEFAKHIVLYGEILEA